MQDKRIALVEQNNFRKDVPSFKAGDTVRVHWKIKEGEKSRVQAFEGMVIRRTEKGTRASFTVRKVSYGVGVERIFPLHSPSYEKIEILSEGKVRRANLYYLRGLQGKAARVQTKDEGDGRDAAKAADKAADKAASDKAASDKAAAAPTK